MADDEELLVVAAQRADSLVEQHLPAGGRECGDGLRFGSEESPARPGATATPDP